MQLSKFRIIFDIKLLKVVQKDFQNNYSIGFFPKFKISFGRIVRNSFGNVSEHFQRLSETFRMGCRRNFIT
jgi:hypothetical protein